MQATNKPTPTASSSFGGISGPAHASNLSFYDDLPSSDVALDDFEEFAVARLKVLRRIDVLQAHGTVGEKFAADVARADKENLPVRRATFAADRFRDAVSHFALRMAYCRTEELRRWFLKNESRLFAVRFAAASPAEADTFMEANGLRYAPIGAAERERLRAPLTAASGGSPAGPPSAQQFERTRYYRVPFAEVTGLVARRDVYVEGGCAYVPHDKISVRIEERFRASLSKSLTAAFKRSATIERDARVAPLVKILGRVAFKYGGQAGPTAGGADHETVVRTFTDYLSSIGHTEPKTKPAGISKVFLTVGTRKPNEKDKTCPIAGRVHKSNTQKYTVFLDTHVMMQGCWDGECQATKRNVFYQIRDGKCHKVGWTPPPVGPPSSDVKVETVGSHSQAAIFGGL